MRCVILTVWMIIHLTLALCLNIAGAGVGSLDLGGHPAIAFYARITGLICTYGFFAPQVASPCYLEVGLADSANTGRIDVHSPRFTGNEARLRFHNFSTLFLDLAPAADQPPTPADTLYSKRLARAFARSIAEREAQRMHKKLTYCRVFVYRHPPLNGYGNGKAARTTNLYVYYYDTP